MRDHNRQQEKGLRYDSQDLRSSQQGQARIGKHQRVNSFSTRIDE